MLPCYCGSIITGSVSTLTRENCYVAAADDGHVFDTFAVTLLGISRKSVGPNQNEALISSKDLS